MATLTFLPGIIQQMNVTTPAELAAGLQGAADALNEALVQSGASLPTIDDENPPVQDSIFVVTESEDEMVADGIYAFDGSAWILILDNGAAALAAAVSAINEDIDGEVETLNAAIMAARDQFGDTLPAADDSIEGQLFYLAGASIRTNDVGVYAFTGGAWRQQIRTNDGVLALRRSSTVADRTQLMRQLTDEIFVGRLDLWALNDSLLRQLVDTNFELTETNQTNIATNASNISQNVTLINNVNGALNDARADIMGNTNLIEALQSDVTTLSQSLTTAQAAIVALQEQVANLSVPARNDGNFNRWIRTNSEINAWEPQVTQGFPQTWPELDITFLNQASASLPYTQISGDFTALANTDATYYEVTNGAIVSFTQSDGTRVFRAFAYVDNRDQDLFPWLTNGSTHTSFNNALTNLNSAIQAGGDRYIIGG